MSVILYSLVICIRGSLTFVQVHAVDLDHSDLHCHDTDSSNSVARNTYVSDRHTGI